MVLNRAVAAEVFVVDELFAGLLDATHRVEKFFIFRQFLLDQYRQARVQAGPPAERVLIPALLRLF